MRAASVWARLLGVSQAVIERVEVELDGSGREVVVATVRPWRRERHRCPLCRRRCPVYDPGRGPRRWRALDLGTTRAYVQADAPRVTCPEHGVRVAHVPWARPGARHTRAFDDQVAWLATQASSHAVRTLMRTSWRTVGAIAARVWAETGGALDLLDGLTRIGIDEISILKGHRHLTIVVDHDTGHLVWAGEGNNAETLRTFFDALGPERARILTHVSADGAGWIETVVAQRAPAAARCADPFHIVAWAVDALDQVRRQAWNNAAGRVRGTRRTTGRGATGQARDLKQARWALWKNPENLTDKQRSQLAWIVTTDPALYDAYLLKEALRTVFAAETPAIGTEALDTWTTLARDSGLPPFTTLATKITRHRQRIINTLTSGLSNARVESTNTKIRLITRRAYGFHSATTVIGWAILNLAGHPPRLPDRP